MILGSEHAHRKLLSRSNDNWRGPQCEERAGFNPLRLGASPPPILHPQALEHRRAEDLRQSFIVAHGGPLTTGCSMGLVSTSAKPSLLASLVPSFDGRSVVGGKASDSPLFLSALAGHRFE